MASLSDESEFTSTSIIKSDRIGRTHYSQEYRDEVLAAFSKSSLSGPAFAQQCGIKYPTFASWVTKRRAKPAQSAPPEHAGTFLLAKLSDHLPNDEGLQINLPAGVILTMTSSAQAPLLAALIKALA